MSSNIMSMYCCVKLFIAISWFVLQYQVESYFDTVGKTMWCYVVHCHNMDFLIRLQTLLVFYVGSFSYIVILCNVILIHTF